MPLPLGGAKGAGMSLVFELITSVLVGAPIVSSFHSDDPQGRVHRQNALILALDPATFGDPALFTAHVSETLTALQALPSAGEVRYPGQNSAAIAVTRGKEGIPIGPKVWGELEVAAGRLGIPLPVPA